MLCYTINLSSKLKLNKLTVDSNVASNFGPYSINKHSFKLGSNGQHEVKLTDFSLYFFCGFLHDKN